MRTLSGHRKEVLHVHAYADHVASCSGDGHVLVWSIAHSGAELLRRWTTWGASCVRLDAADQLTCGGEGTEPITVYNWRTGAVLSTYADDEPPLGVCSCLQREGVVLAAGNTFSHSQVRVWDVSRGSLTDRFSLAPQCRGVRCLQIVTGAVESRFRPACERCPPAQTHDHCCAPLPPRRAAILALFTHRGTAARRPTHAAPQEPRAAPPPPSHPPLQQQEQE